MSFFKKLASLFVTFEEAKPLPIEQDVVLKQNHEDTSPFMKDVFEDIKKAQLEAVKQYEPEIKRVESPVLIKETVETVDNKYKGHKDAVIISCFFSPTKSKYRLDAFNKFYESTKHLNHRVIECIIGNDHPQLPENKFISHVYTKSLLWHKEALLNKVIANLPKEFKYIFWIDGDVTFTNLNWVVEGVEQLQTCNILQPFEYCTHLDRDETEPGDMAAFQRACVDSSHGIPNKKVWRSFCANYVDFRERSANEIYDVHGHVGFAWGARREVLDQCPLYDRALVGGADHIIAHAAAGQIVHSCIQKTFTSDLEEVKIWSNKFYKTTKGKIGYVKGNLYHTWHGDIEKRRYFKRIQDLTKKFKGVTHKDNNGLYITDDSYIIDYMMNYFMIREVIDDNDNVSYVGTGDDPTVQFDGFGGGQFSGGGANGSWDDQNQQQTQQDSVQNQLSDYNEPNSNNPNFS